jgi:glycosyltransferase involved in cell wall biosynthesis
MPRDLLATGTLRSVDIRDARPRVAVVVPVYERPDVLERALRSVLVEPMRELEVIVVDDDSTLPIEPVVERMGDRRVRYIRRTANGGPAAARNTGLDEVVAPHVIFLDSDDELNPGVLARANSVLEAAAPDICGVETAWARDRNVNAPRVFSSSYEGFRRLDVLFHISAFVFRTEIVRRYRFDLRLWIAEDWDLVLRLLPDRSFLPYPETMTLVHTDAPERLTNRWPARPDQIEYLYRKHEIHRADRPTRAQWHFKLSRWYARAGDMRSARHCLIRSVAEDPRKAQRLALLGGMTRDVRLWHRYSVALLRVAGRGDASL